MSTLISCGSSSIDVRRRNAADARAAVGAFDAAGRRIGRQLQRGPDLLRIRLAHRAELEHLERTPVAPDSHLPEEDRAPEREPDRDRGGDQQREGEQQHEGRDDSVETVLDSKLPGARAGDLHANRVARV